MSIFFSKMLGTLAVIMVIAASIGGSDLFGKFFGAEEKWKYALLACIFHSCSLWSNPLGQPLIS